MKQSVENALIKTAFAAVFVAVFAFGCRGGFREPCQSDGRCNTGLVCIQDTCLGAFGNGGGGGSAGGGAAGGGGGSGGGIATYCNPNLACAEWQECAPTASGGNCEDAQLEIKWLTPDSGVRTAARSVVGSLSVQKRDGGVVPAGARPVLLAPADAGTVSGTQSPYTVELTLGDADGEQTYRAGWASGGAEATLTVNVDRTGPAFVIEPVGDAGYPGGAADFIPEDPSSAGAFRKDEVVQVKVTTTASDVAAVKLLAKFGTETAYEVTTSTSCAAASGRCEQFQLDLSRVPMHAFRGNVQLTVEGTDTLGNTSTQTPRDIPVTRWQWARKLGGAGVSSLRSPPAIGVGGRLFVGVSNADLGNGVYAVEPDGRIVWSRTDLGGAIEGTVAVGRSATDGGGSEYVFVQPATGPGRLWALYSGDGGVAYDCNGIGGASNGAGVALLADGTAGVAAIGIQSASSASSTEGRGMVLVPGRGQCVGSAVVPSVEAPGNIVSAGLAAYFVESTGSLRALDFDGNTLALRGLNQQVGASVFGVDGLMMTSASRVVGGGVQIGPFAFEVSGSSATNPWAAVFSRPATAPVMGAGGVFGAIRTMMGAELIRINAGDGMELARVALTDQSGSAAFFGSSMSGPVLGAGGHLYIVDSDGKLFVLPQGFTSSTTALWSEGLTSAVVGQVKGSPSLDCNRRRPLGETGILYIGTETGWLVSYLVDSKGLDPTAPWPKYARDARNTGNFDGPAIGCP